MIGAFFATALSPVVLGLPLDTPFAERAQQVVYATVAMDPALLFGVGYGHAVTLNAAPLPRRLAFAVDLRTVPSFSSWDLRGSVGARAFEAPGFDVAFGLELELKLLSNPVHDGLSFVPRLTVAPGYFGERWFLAAEVSFQFALVNVLWHSEAYKDIYPDVHDGFWPPGAPYWYPGARAGVLLGGVVTDLGFSWRLPGDFNDKGPYLVSYTVDLRAGVRF